MSERTYLWILCNDDCLKVLCMSSTFVNTPFRAGMGWVCVLLLSEKSSGICTIHSECNCGAFEYLGLGRFRMRTLICSPPQLAWWVGLRQTGCRPAPAHVSIMSLGKGHTLWLPNTPHDAHDLKVLNRLVLLGFLSQGLGKTFAA